MSTLSSDESDLSIPLTSNEAQSDSTESKKKLHSQVNFSESNIISRLFFWWSRLAIKLSNKGILRTKDVSALSKEQSTGVHIVKLTKNWNHYSKNKTATYPLVSSLFQTHYCEIIALFFLEILFMGTDYLNVFFFRQMIQFFSYDLDNMKPLFTLMQSAVSIIVLRFLRSVIFNHMEFRNVLVSERITNELTALLYEKILKANTNGNQSAKEEGEKLNLIEIDAEKVGFLFFIGPKIIMGPISVGFSLYLLFNLFGFGFIYTFIILCVLLGIILLLQILFLKNYKKNLVKKDARMKIVTNTFQILKSLKLNGWDNEFINKIKDKRDKELKYFIKNQNITVIRSLMNSNLPLIMLIVSLGVYVYTNQDIEISNLFTAFQLINQMTMPLLGIPLVITGFFSNLISIKRLQEFLASSEHDYSTHEDIKAYNDKGIQIKFSNVSFGVSNIELLQPNNNNSLDSSKVQRLRTSSASSEHSMKANNNSKLTLLKDLNLEIKKGEFVAIIGPTGSGKSCLLNAILNDYELLHSDEPIIVNGPLSYLSQQPWVMHETIKNNVLFFNNYQSERYDKVITSCQLKKDLEEFEDGDNHEINSSGGNISGGQKARIALARCLYKEADLYLLDDPLASIDTKVAHNIFMQGFCGFLNGKTRIVATNEMYNLSMFDKIVLMDKGSIKFIGNYEEFQKQYGKEYHKTSEKAVKANAFKRKRSERKPVQITQHEIKKQEAKKFGLISKQHKSENGKEKSNKGRISLELYNKFVKLTGGYCLFIFLVLLIVCAQIAKLYRELFITSWSKTRKDLISTPHDVSVEKHEDGMNNYYTYIKISLIGIFCNFLIDFIISRIQINCLRTLHETMITKLIKAPINLFHDIVPIGQILNRLTKDLELIHQIIFQIMKFLRSNFSLIMSMYVCYSYNPYSLLVSPGLVIIGILLTNHYISSARNLHRLHRVSYSPILTILTESIKGAETIRTAGTEVYMREKIYRRLDDHFGVHLYCEGTNKWYRIMLNSCSQVFFGLIVGYIIMNKENFTAQAIGLILQYATTLNEQLVMTMNFYSQIEVSMVCLERCEAYTTIPGEKEGGMKSNPQNKTKKLDSKVTSDDIDYITWPTKGKIRFDNFTARYRKETPVVLSKLNLEIKPGEKMGIVGRTGSGKSTIVLALSRIIEGEEGKIEIDNIDISKISLETLRQNITVVPQDPFILEASLKENIDPLNKSNDEEIIRILDDFCLFTSIEKKEERLNLMIKENGTNLSIGEKQLICFARAAMKKSKIVILDEATASIDVHTEKILQQNIEKYFKEATVIIIAHHIQMVEGCERIVVIDNGKVIECDTYETLLANHKSKFYELYSESLAS